MAEDPDSPPVPSCCSAPGACVFSKALLARQARCTLAQRQSVGEQDVVVCPQPTSRTNCETLLALMRERAAFPLKLPRAGAPLVHARALQLQCGGIQGLARVLDADAADIHQLVGEAQSRYGSLLALPWADVIEVMTQWSNHRPRRGPAT